MPRARRRLQPPGTLALDSPLTPLTPSRLTQINELCRVLGADRGRLALSLCDGFGIPPHLLAGEQNVAQNNWRTFPGCD